MFTELGENIRLADGPVAEVLGFHYPTRMAIIRLAKGDLFIWSPVELTEDLRRVTDALGPVAHIVAPNHLHHLHLGGWAAAYPEATFHAPPGLRAKRPDIAFHRDLGDAPDPAWAGQIDQVIMRGNRITEEVVFFHSASRTVLFTDLLQHFPDDWFTGWRRLIAKLDLMVAAEPSVPRKFRLAFRDRKAARAALATVFEWEAETVIMAHGAPVERDAKSFLRRAFRFLAA